MKKSILAIIATVTLSTSAMAQSENGNAPQRPQMDRTEMVKNQTDRMVKEYGLNDEQAAKLLELNTSFADKMPRMRGGQRPGGGQRGGMRQRNTDGNTGATAQGERQGRPSREEMEARMKEMRANQEAYQGELKKIMTEEQFAKYQEDSQRRPQFGGGQGGRQGGGQRGFRGGNRQQGE